MRREVIVKTLYECPICKKGYNNRREAESCLKEGFNPKFKVGDIVFTKAGFGWFDGDEKWISNPDARKKKKHDGCHSDCCTFKFYYVISHIDADPDDLHRVRYHVFTDAMKGCYRDGYTFDVGHYTPELVENPPEYIVKNSKKFIAKKSGYLL